MRTLLKTNRTRTQKVPVPDLEKLKNPEIADRYRTEISNRFSGDGERELQWRDVTSIVRETAIEVLGPKQRTAKNEWFDDECKNVSELRKLVRKEWLHNTQDERKKEQLRNVTKVAKMTYKRKKRTALEVILKEIEEDRGQGRVREQFQKIKAVRNGYQPRAEIVRDEEG